MALQQVVPISILLLGDGSSTVFTFALGDLYQISSGNAVPYGDLGAIPTSVTPSNTNPPIYFDTIQSATIDGSGNITITLTSAIAADQIVNFVLNLLFNSGDVSSFPSPKPVTITGVTPVGGNLPVSIATPVSVTQGTSPWVVSGSISATNLSIGPTGAAVPADATMVGGTDGTDLRALATDATGQLKVLVENTVPITGTVAVSNFPVTQPVSGSVAVSNFPATQPVSGTVAVSNFPATQPVSIAAPVAVTGTFFQATQPVSGTVIAEIEGHAGATLDGTAGAPSAGVLTVQGVGGGTAIPVSGTVAVSNFPATQPVSGALTNNNAAPAATNIGVLPAIAETAYGTVTYTTGDQVLPVTDLHGAANEDLQAVGGTAVVTAAAGVLKVGISGNAAATMDAVTTAATAPANGLAILSVNNTTAPSLTTGQSVAHQCDYEGSLFVKPYRRSQTVSQATTIAATTSPTTILAAQGAGIFADISSLIVTATPGATGTAFTLTLTDGTTNYIFDMDTGSTTTLVQNGILNLTFNPPLPAATAAHSWVLANSSATPTVHVTVVAVLQRAS